MGEFNEKKRPAVQEAVVHKKKKFKKDKLSCTSASCFNSMLPSLNLFRKLDVFYNVYCIGADCLLRDRAEEYTLSSLSGLDRDKVLQLSSDNGGGDVLVLDRAALLDNIQALGKGLRAELQAAAEEKFPLIEIDYINTSIINDVKGTDRICSISLKIQIDISVKGTAGILRRKVHVSIPLYETVFLQKATSCGNGGSPKESDMP